MMRSPGSTSPYLSLKIIRYRWLILLISGIVTIGNYYCFDIPSVIYEQLSEYFQTISLFDLKFNMLYILYSIPNILLPLFGGYLVDLWGKRTMIIIFSVVILVGQLIVAIGCTLKDFNMILFGRFIFGIGGESLMVSLLTLLTSWFEGKELAFSLGLMFSFARLGSAGNAWVSPSIAYDKGVAIVFWFGTLLCFFSFVSTLFVVVMDQFFKSPYESESDRSEYSEIENSEGSTLNSASSQSEYYPDVETFQNTMTNSKIGRVPLAELPPLDPHLTEYVGPSDNTIEEISLPAPSPPNRKGQAIHFNDCIQNIERNLRVDETAERERNFSIDTVPEGDEENPLPGKDSPSLGAEPFEDKSPREYLTLEDLQSRKKPLWPPEKNLNFWLVLLCCCCMYAALIPFISISNEVIQVAYYARRAEKHEEAVEYIVSRLQGMLFLLAAILAPLMGIIIDFIGYRPALIVTSSLFLFISHSLMMLGIGDPLVPLLLVGTAYSLFAAVIWSVVPMIVDGYLQGVAFGLMTALQNFSQSAVPAIVSYILMENDEHFHKESHALSKVPSRTRMAGISECEFMFAFLSLAAAVAGMMLWYLDEYPPNNAPRGVLRAATKFSFDEIEKRARYNPTNVQPVYYSYNGSSSSSTSSAQSYHDAETPSRATDYEVQDDDSDKVDRSDWIPYDQSDDHPATEMTPLLPSGTSLPENYQSMTIPEDEVLPMDTTPMNGLMPPRRPSILRHFSVYSPSQAGPHGKGHIQKAISFTGEGPFPERKPGTGQHPPIQMIRRNSLNLNRRKFTHF